MKIFRYPLGEMQNCHLRYASPDGNVFLAILTRGKTEEEVNLALLASLENLSGEIEKAKIDLQAPKNKCGSCKHFRYLNQPEGNLKINGVCFEEQYGAILRDSQYLACPSYERSLSKGAVEEWEESF